MQNIPKDLKIIELGDKVLRKLLVLKEYKDRDELLFIANSALELIRDDETISNDLKEAYKIAIDRIKSFTWAELQNIKSRIN